MSAMRGTRCGATVWSMGVHAAVTAYVGDTASDAEAGRGAGVRVVLFGRVLAGDPMQGLRISWLGRCVGPLVKARLNLRPEMVNYRRLPALAGRDCHD